MLETEEGQILVPDNPTVPSQTITDTIELWQYDCDHCGLIVPCASGVRWTNQVGGVRLCHPVVEGIYVPLLIKIEEWASIADHAWEFDFVRTKIPEFLTANDIEDMFHLPDEFEGNCGEAWVPLIVTKQPEDWHPHHYHNSKVLQPLEGKLVILTWPNSD